MFRRKNQKESELIIKRKQIIKEGEVNNRKKILTLFIVVFMIMTITIGDSYIHAENPMNYSQEEQTNEISDASYNVMPVASATWRNWSISASSSDMWSTNEENGVLMINKGGDITIDGANNLVTNTICVNTNDTVYLRINNVEIEGEKVPIDIQSGIVYLELKGDNFLQPWIGPDMPGITVSQNSDLYIIGDGSLFGNRIGSLDNTDCGFIVIDSGTIDVQGGSTGAAIGGGKNSSVLGIRINGGAIDVRSSGTGAGIGTGEDGRIDEITINGGDIKVRSGDAAAIGGGKASTTGSVKIKNITINGGNVKAKSMGLKATAIGGGENGTVDSMTITGGTISVFSMGAAVGQAADIGGGYGLMDEMGDFWISGGSIYSRNNKFSKTPLNNDRDRTPVFCLELTNQVGTKNVKVDGVDFKIDSNHQEYGSSELPASDSFYLYMAGGKNHIITVTDASDNVTHYEAVWDSYRQKFTISDERIAGDFIVEGGTKGTDWNYDSSSNHLRITKSGSYSVYSCVEKTKQTIYIDRDVTPTLTINDLFIDSERTPCISLNENTKIKLDIVGENTLYTSKSPYGAPSIFVPLNAILEVSGEGKLICKAKEGAAIGGGDGIVNGSITINSGTIEAKSESGAGIGGGYGTIGQNIIINDGIITAESISGAGIGGGEGAQGEYITINAGHVIAKSTDGAGIGGGMGFFGIDMEFNGGTITAKSTNGDGIGDGVNSEAISPSTNIFVNAASVWATGKKAFSIQVMNENLDEVELYELKNQTSTSNLTVDGIAYTLGGAHPESSSYYLYLTKAEHAIVSGDTIYNIKWYENDGMFKLKTPLPIVSISETKVDSIFLESSSATNIYGEIEYSLDGKTWQLEGSFNNLKASMAYTIYARYQGKGDYGTSDSTTVSATTQNPSYTITIPSTMTAGGNSLNIAVNTAQSFALGYGGQVNVKVMSGIASSGIMTLTRTAGTIKPTISSQFKVNNANFTNTNNNVATFKTKTDAAVPISFAKPTHASGVVPAGVYNGTVVFTMTYTQ